MKYNKLKIAITCPHCDFEGKTNLFSSGSKKLCTRCKRDFIFDDSIKVKYSFYCPHCNKYGSSRNLSIGKNATCARCQGEVFITKDGVKPLIIFIVAKVYLKAMRNGAELHFLEKILINLATFKLIWIAVKSKKESGQHNIKNSGQNYLSKNLILNSQRIVKNNLGNITLLFQVRLKIYY